MKLAVAIPAFQEKFLVQAAFYSGLALAGMVGLLMFAIVSMRLWLVFERWRERQFLKVWRPRLMKYLVGEPVRLPRLKRHERVLMFGLWTHMVESVRGSARDQLNAFAREIGLDRAAWRFIHSRNPRKQLIGLIALGNLREGKAWFVLSDWVQKENPVHSIAALRGLLLIDPRRALPLVVMHIARRSDWSPVRVASFLKEAGSDAIYRVMGKSALNASPAEAIRLVKYLNATNAHEAMPMIRKLLAQTEDPGVVAACLPMLREPVDLPALRRYCKHPMWFVRVQAAAALGKIGEPGDEEVLEELLRDPNWWVRYRGAQAMASLPFMGTGMLRDMKEHHEDAYARDILSQVLAETPLA